MVRITKSIALIIKKNRFTSATNSFNDYKFNNLKINYQIKPSFTDKK